MTNKEYDKAIYEVVKDFELKKKAIMLEYGVVRQSNIITINGKPVA